MAATLNFRHDYDGDVRDHKLVITSPDEWERMPESRSGVFSTVVLGGQLFALAPVLPGVDDAAPPSPRAAWLRGIDWPMRG